MPNPFEAISDKCKQNEAQNEMNRQRRKKAYKQQRRLRQFDTRFRLANEREKFYTINYLRFRDFSSVHHQSNCVLCVCSVHSHLATSGQKERNADVQI